MFHKLFGFVHAGVPEVKLMAEPALVAVFAKPGAVLAYDVLPRIPLGFVQAVPPGTSVATSGTFGPTNSPVVEMAIPWSPVYVPAGPLTSAMKVLAIALTKITTMFCPLKNEADPVNPFSKNSSLTTGSLPV